MPTPTNNIRSRFHFPRICYLGTFETFIKNTMQENPLVEVNGGASSVIARAGRYRLRFVGSLCIPVVSELSLVLPWTTCREVLQPDPHTT